jgi:hypothetical protein
LYGILIIKNVCTGGSRAALSNTKSKSLGSLVGAFKTVSTKHINKTWGTPGAKVWQRNYYEHVIRSDDELNRIREYIFNNPLIGRRLYSLLVEAGFGGVEVVPKSAYVDTSNKVGIQDVLEKILVPMATTAREQALELELLPEREWDRGLAEFSDVGDAHDGSLFYTWFKGVGRER